jgi:hypothetical protein
VTSPHYPSIDREFLKKMFNSSADTLDQKIENSIEKKMVRLEKWKKRRIMERRMKKKILMIMFKILKFFLSKKRGLLEDNGFLWKIIIMKYGINF